MRTPCLLALRYLAASGLVIGALYGCGGNGTNQDGRGGGGTNGFQLSASVVQCANETIVVKKGSTTFPSGTSVDFVNQKTMTTYTGSYSLITSGIQTTFPSTAPVGFYNVEISIPGDSIEDAGQIDYEGNAQCGGL